MGDYADMSIDAGLAEWGRGEYDDEDVPASIWRRRKPTSKTCNRCGTSGLFWDKDGDDRWRLYAYEWSGLKIIDFKPHFCRFAPPPAQTEVKP